MDPAVEVATERRPEWLKIRLHTGPNYREVKALVRGLNLHTVCEEAHCPNIYECWEHRTATYMILGSICTWRCAYCAVQTGKPMPVDWAEPFRVAKAVKVMGLKHAVVTSVSRNDLPDGGAEVFARTIRAIRALNPECTVEVLIPDFRGSEEALRTVLDARPDVLNHNIETVRRLHRKIRPAGRYWRSIELLRKSKELAPEVPTKSGIIVGMGETKDEILETMADLRSARVDLLTIGQYLRPSKNHWPVVKYYTPEEFEELKVEGLKMGFAHVESGPLVRSSYHAWEQVDEMRRRASVENG